MPPAYATRMAVITSRIGFRSAFAEVTPGLRPERAMDSVMWGSDPRPVPPCDLSRPFYKALQD